MENIVYQEAEFVIMEVDKGYIVVNIRLGFSKGHTHIDHYQTAKYLIHLSAKKALPHDLPRYLLVSLKRISSDEIYRKKISELLSNKRKKLGYYNKRNFYA